MSDRPVVTAVRRKGDVLAPTISDVEYEDLKFVLLERPRQPDPKDYAHDGKPHPCIPAGEYDVDWTVNLHPKHPLCFQVKTGPGTPAPDRSDILWHSANWIRQLLGCQAPGLKAEIVEGTYEGQAVRELGVSGSRDALSAFLGKMGPRGFRLIVKEA